MSFKIGNWIKVTDTKDVRWSLWSDDHTAVCGRIGQITSTYDAPDGTRYYDVDFYLRYRVEQLAHGTHNLEFLASHMSLSTKYDGEIFAHREKSQRELQKWEALSRKKSDEALSSVFRKKPKVKKVEVPVEPEIPQPVDFEGFGMHDELYNTDYLFDDDD